LLIVKEQTYRKEMVNIVVFCVNIDVIMSRDEEDTSVLLDFDEIFVFEMV
jgi:hypothetical protein